MTVLWGEVESNRKPLKQVVGELKASEVLGIDRDLAGKRSPFRCPGCGKSLSWREYARGVCEGDR